MSFIKSYGIALPHFRVEDATLHPPVTAKKSSFKSVCFTDEDIITLSFEATANCLHNLSPALVIDGIFFASSTPVFHNRYHASFLADLLNLPQGTLAIDFINSARSATDALLMANHLINSGRYKNILVIASDVNFPAIGNEHSTPFGHAACAILLNNQDGIAEISSASSFSSSHAEEFSYKDKNVLYDPRFSREAGFKNNLSNSLKSFSDPKKYDTIILNSLFARMAGGIFLKAGFTEKQFSKDPLLSKIGNTGCVHALLLLINQLESILPGKDEEGTILLIDYSNGSNFFEITRISSPKKKLLEEKLNNYEMINNYHDYLKLRKAGSFTSAKYETNEMFSSEMMNIREKENFIYLNGFECETCKTSYLIKTSRCKKCKGENFIIKKLSRTGTIFSCTDEHYFPATFPPVTMAIIDLTDGGRITVQQTDTMYPDRNKMQIGLTVTLVLRKIIENDAKPNYFWKCIPS